ncbi:MAG: hypothetical protein ABR602_11355 [Gemmatimonadales bacterium]
MTAGPLALLLIGLAAALAVASYCVQGVPARRLWPAVLGRAVAWSGVVALVLNPGCAVGGPPVRPLVLLDTSLSLSGAGGDLAGARALADSLGEVHPFGSSRLRPPLIAAAASGRPVVVVSDGEIRDAFEVPADLLAGASVRLVPRRRLDDLAITAVEAPRWVQSGDTLRIQATVEVFGEPVRGPVSIEVRSGDRVIGRGELDLAGARRGQVAVAVATGGLGSGEQVLEVMVGGHRDAEPRTDRRWRVVTITPSPGIVVVAAAPGWESRFLFRTIGELAGLPVRGYLQVEPGAWRRMDGLTPVGTATVAEAVRRADLLVSFGAPVPGSGETRARGHWDWPVASPVSGDWFLVPVPGAPAGAGLGAIPAESLPPATALGALEPSATGWTGMRAQLSRRGPERAAVIGEVRGNRRQVVVGASGLWRWSFRGGIAEQAYRIWVAETMTWLLGGAGASGDMVRPLRQVVEQDEPVVFEQVGTPRESFLAVAWTGDVTTRVDTLAFAGDGRASVNLPPGVWQYRIGPSDSGMVVVEEYSAEFLPVPVSLGAQEARLVPAPPRRPVRDLPWLFAIPLVAWCLEWWTRRRAGLR